MTLVVFTLYVIVSLSIIRHLFAHLDAIGGLWFLLAFVYSIFGYAAYAFDREIFHFYNVTVIRSDDIKLGIYLGIVLLISFFVYNTIKNKKLKISTNPIIKGFSYGVAFPPYALAVAILLIFFIININDFSWGEGKSGIDGFFWYPFRLIELVTVMISVTSLMRKKIVRILIFLSLIFILIGNFKAGNRSDIVYILLAYFVVMVHGRIRVNAKWMIRNSPALIFALVFLQFLYVVREMDSSLAYGNIYDHLSELISAIDFDSLKNKFYMQDYFAPSATLVLVVDGDVVDPFSWLWSNVYNAIPGLKYPTVSDLILQRHDQEFVRGAGFSYLLFADGYLIMGMFGAFIIGVISGAIPAIFALVSELVKPNFKAVILVAFGFFALQLLRNPIGIGFRVFITLFIPSFCYIAILLGSKSER